MSCIEQLLELKGDKKFLPVNEHCVIEGGGVYKGYEYLITFTRFGTRCGYVAIPQEHQDDNENIECHGGITFSGQDHNAKDLLPIPCNDLWIGFDANHFRDLPDYDLAATYFGKESERLRDLMKESKGWNEDLTLGGLQRTHKSYGYIEMECKSIIDQLRGLQ